MTWLWGFAIFGAVCLVAIIVIGGMIIRQIERDGWNR